MSPAHARIDRRRKIPVTSLLFALGLDGETILNTFYKQIPYKRQKDGWRVPFDANRLKGYKAVNDLVDADSGKVVVEEIKKVRSVDVVADPATTRGLFEQQESVDMEEIKQLQEQVAKLTDDLKSVATTPNFTFITPNLCNDGHDSPCVTGAPGGLVSADAFLQKWVPLIMASPAYQQDGLLIINFDESAYASQTMDTTTTPPTLTPGRMRPAYHRRVPRKLKTTAAKKITSPAKRASRICSSEETGRAGEPRRRTGTSSTRSSPGMRSSPA